jgi:hypothetical protein
LRIADCGFQSGLNNAAAAAGKAVHDILTRRFVGRVIGNAPIFFLDRFKHAIKMSLPTLKLGNVGKLIFKMSQKAIR